MIGTTIDGKYEVLSQLGSGAMGTVYEARNVQTGRTVAVKVIQGALVTDPALLARFQREARAAGAIDSLHIAQVLDAGQDRTTEAPYLVMELLKGEDVEVLARHLGAMRPGLALRIIAQALSGLERAHAVGVIHRDIKPANLFVAKGDAGQRVVKLVDFGIAKVKDELAASNHALTQTSALLGSPLYMSPEQAKASKKVDGRADLWSLGVVLYQLLTGKAPHAHAESLTELLLAICTEDAKPVQQVAPWVPANVAEVVESAIRLDPSKRFATAKEMRDAIAAIVPDFTVLTDAMLTPMTADERSFVAEPSASSTSLGVTTGPATSEPRASFAQSPALGGATVLDAPSSASPSPLASSRPQGSSPALARSGPAVMDSQAGTAGTTGAATPPTSRSSRVLPLAIGGAVVAVVIGLVGVRSLRGTTQVPVPASSGIVQSVSARPADPASDPPKPDAAIATVAPIASETSPAASTSSSSVPPVPPRARPSISAAPSAKPPASVAPPIKPPPPAPSSNISREFN